jgi:biotin carboxylase
MPRILLVLPAAGYRTEDFVAAARALGADVAVASDRGQAIRRTLRVDLTDPERAADAIVREAGRRPLDAVVAADEAGVMAAAIASQRLGLRSNPPEAAARTRDKLVMRRALAAGDVAQPRFTALPAGHEPQGPYPIVVKPLSLSGGRGVIRADDAAAAGEAARRIRRMLDDPQATLLSEEYVPGPEVAVEALLRGETLEVLAVFDKPDPLVGPYFEETIYVTPSRHAAESVTAAEETTAAAARALGLREGPVHAELRLGAAGPVVIELAARSIGGLCARTLRFGLGMSLEELILRHALGMPLGGRLRREGAAAGVMMLPIPAAGTLVRVAGVDDARAVALIEDVRITIPAGRPIVPLPDGDRYLGFVFSRGETPAAVEHALREAHTALDVVIEPV